MRETTVAATAATANKRRATQTRTARPAVEEAVREVSQRSREATGMAQRRSQQRVVDQLPGLMQSRGLSINRLADLVGVSQSHLSRVLRSADRKSVSGDLAERIAIALGMPDDWFPETRRERVLERSGHTLSCATASTTSFWPTSPARARDRRPSRTAG